jgi:hypothetical protein
MSFSPNSCVGVSLSPVSIDRMRPRCFAKIINFPAYAWAMWGNAGKICGDMRGYAGKCVGNLFQVTFFLKQLDKSFIYCPGGFRVIALPSFEFSSGTIMRGCPDILPLMNRASPTVRGLSAFVQSLIEYRKADH